MFTPCLPSHPLMATDHPCPLAIMSNAALARTCLSACFSCLWGNACCNELADCGSFYAWLSEALPSCSPRLLNHITFPAAMCKGFNCLLFLTVFISFWTGVSLTPVLQVCRSCSFFLGLMLSKTQECSRDFSHTPP